MYWAETDMLMLFGKFMIGSQVQAPFSLDNTSID